MIIKHSKLKKINEIKDIGQNKIQILTKPRKISRELQYTINN